MPRRSIDPHREREARQDLDGIRRPGPCRQAPPGRHPGRRLDATASITVVPFTTGPTDAPLFSPPIEPARTNGLQAASRLMADKVTTVARTKLGNGVGSLGREEARRLDRALLAFLGLAG